MQSLASQSRAGVLAPRCPGRQRAPACRAMAADPNLLKKPELKRPESPPKKLFDDAQQPAAAAAPAASSAPAAAGPSSSGEPTIEWQRQRAKEMRAYFQEQRLEAQVKKGKLFGWTPANEIGNGRWVMFGVFVGLLTEYATGVDFPHQIGLLLSYLGIVDAKVVKEAGAPRVVKGTCFVTKDNIDTDQIIPAEYLTLVPSKPDEYEKLGSYALIGLPEDLYPTRFVAEGSMKTPYAVIIGGQNFGCGSSREHAPVALGAAGSQVVVAESYARIFFRNCIATGELYPVETDLRLCDELTTGQEVTVDMEANVLINHTTGKEYALKPLGDAGPVIDAGGIFDFARAQGMIKTVAA
ncbi:SSU1 [Scenedesmus sp. PABB004]|nr:SSU1 [Scenedesmus sp. PABB004]